MRLKSKFKIKVKPKKVHATYLILYALSFTQKHSFTAE